METQYETEESLNIKINSISLVYIEQLKKLLLVSTNIKNTSFFSINKKDLKKEYDELKIIVESLHKTLYKLRQDVTKLQGGEKIIKEVEFNEEYYIA